MNSEKGCRPDPGTASLFDAVYALTEKTEKTGMYNSITENNNTHNIHSSDHFRRSAVFHSDDRQYFHPIIDRTRLFSEMRTIV